MTQKQIDTIVKFAKDMYNESSRFYDYQRKCWRNPNGLCQAFCKSAYWLAGIESLYSSAKQCKDDVMIKNTAHIKKPPVASVVFFKSNTEYEHIGISIGNGEYIHAGTSRMRKGKIADRNDYLGYGWIGKKSLAEKEVAEVEKKLKINLDGTVKEVNAIEKNGYNYVKLQDLRCKNIAIEYTNIPVVRVNK